MSALSSDVKPAVEKQTLPSTPPLPSQRGVCACARVCVNVCRSSVTQTVAISRRGYEISCFAQMCRSARLRLGGAELRSPSALTSPRSLIAANHADVRAPTPSGTYCKYVNISPSDTWTEACTVLLWQIRDASLKTRAKPNYHSGNAQGHGGWNVRKRNWSKGTHTHTKKASFYTYLT